MKNFLNKFKIPTLLGLGIIFTGIIIGVFMILKQQTFLSSAAPNLIPKNIKLSNIQDSSITISWQTDSPALGFVTFGQNNSGEETTLDVRDVKTPQLHLIHYATLKNLLPKTTYQYKIVSGKITSKVFTLTTASSSTNQTNFRPVIGTVLNGSDPLNEGVVFISVTGASLQSALIKNSGNFLIPMAKLYKADLSDLYSLEENTEAKATVISPVGEAAAIFNLRTDGETLPSLSIGQNLDLTDLPASPTPSPIQNLNLYDLNHDGKINAVDYSIAQKNKGKKINGILIDQAYLDELTDMINTLNSQ